MADVPAIQNPPPKHTNIALNVISFAAIATAVLFAMFLILAIFDRILRPHGYCIFRSRRNEERVVPRTATTALSDRSRRNEEVAPRTPATALLDPEKQELGHVNSFSHAVSVIMPGQDYPTCFAMPILSPLTPDGVSWPSHAESSQHTVNVDRGTA